MAGNNTTIQDTVVAAQDVAKAAFRTLWDGRLAHAYDDPAALRAVNATTQNLVYVKSLAAFFRRDTSDTTSADDGNLVVVDGNGNIWKRILSIDSVFNAYGDTSNSPSDRDQYDSEAEGFTFFAVNENGGDGYWYVRDDAAADDWFGPFPFGTEGPAGAAGTSAGAQWNFDTSIDTSVDPGTGDIRLNDATLASVTEVAISDDNANGTDVSAYIATWDDADNTVKGHLILQENGAPQNLVIYEVTAISDQGTFFQVTVQNGVSGGSFGSGDSLVVLFVRAGDQGATGATGSTGATGPAGIDGDDGATIFVQDAEPSTDNPLGSIWVDSDSPDNDLYQLTGSPPTWEDTGVNVKGDTGATGATGATGPAGDDGSLIFVQDAEPSTDNPANSLWIDSDSTDLDVYQLTGSPLQWTDTGDDLKGAAGTSQGLQLVFDDSTVQADPGGPGNFRFDSVLGGSPDVTELYVDNADRFGSDIQAWLDGLDASDNGSDLGALRFTKVGDDSVWAEVTVTGVVVDSGGFRTIPISFVDGPAGFADADQFVVFFSRTGNKGADGAGAVDSVNGLTGVVELHNIRVVTAAGDITMLSADDIIAVNKSSGAATGVTLISASGRKRPVGIKDLKGDANTNTITVTPDGTETIDGANSSVTITFAFGALSLYPLDDGSGWIIM